MHIITTVIVDIMKNSMQDLYIISYSVSGLQCSFPGDLNNHPLSLSLFFSKVAYLVYKHVLEPRLKNLKENGTKARKSAQTHTKKEPTTVLKGYAAVIQRKTTMCTYVDRNCHRCVTTFTVC